MQTGIAYHALGRLKHHGQFAGAEVEPAEPSAGDFGERVVVMAVVGRGANGEKDVRVARQRPGQRFFEQWAVEERAAGR
jgi:hypothetical protein